MYNINSETTTTDGEHQEWYSIGEAGRIINCKGYGRNNLYKLLRAEGIIMMNKEPHQEWIDKGCLRFVRKEILKHGKIHSYETVTLVSGGNGIDLLKKLITKQIS